MNNRYLWLALLVETYEQQIQDGSAAKFLAWVLDNYKPEGFENTEK